MINNSIFPHAYYEFRQNEATGQKTTAIIPVQLISSNNPYGRGVATQILSSKFEEIDRNTTLTPFPSANTDRKERKIDPNSRLPIPGKVVVGPDDPEPPILNQLTDCTPVDGSVPDTCANALSTLFLKEGVAVLRPTFGLNRYNETKNMYV